MLCAAAEAPVGIDALLDAARAAPAEFAADATIRIAALDQVEKARKVELLEQAFQKASGARQPYKRHAVFVRAGSPSGYLNRAYGQDLDAMSLRLRAIEALLPLDGRKARELFLQTPPPKTPRLTCDDFSIYDVGRYYDTLGTIARQADDRFRLLQRFAGDVTSPVQVGPMARMLAGASVKDADFGTLVASFAGALGKVSGDDRSFAYSIGAGKQILALVEELQRRRLSPLPLLEAYRLYLVMNLSSARCADDDSMMGNGMSFGLFTGQAIDQEAQDAVAFFNKSLRMAPLQPIPEEESTPSRLEGAATGLRTCEDAGCRAISEQYKGLVFAENGTAYSADQKATPAWRGKLREFLAALSQWQESASGRQPTAAEFFRMKSTAYSELLNLVFNGADRELVLRAMLDYLKQNQFQRENPLEWFLPVNGLIGRMALDPAAMGRAVEELRKVDDPTIALYANLEILAPRTPERILPLL